MASFWNHTIRRYIQTTAARFSAAEHGSSEGRSHFGGKQCNGFFRFGKFINEITLCNMREKQLVFSFVRHPFEIFFNLMWLSEFEQIG